MSDAQFATVTAFLVSFAGSLLGMVRWAVTRVTAVIIDNTKSHRETAAAHKEAATKFSELSTKVQFAFDASQKVTDRLAEESSGVHQAADADAECETPSRPVPKQTPPRGYPVGVGVHGLKRAATRGGDE